jgi:2',3'-cyclic-nucleotide 2'-phosphodiesterase (5'-nucleotidase family)
MDYDVGLIGNHEFDHGYKKIERFRAIANHPLLTANAIGPDGELLGDAPYLLLDVDGIRVGIIGLITETAPTLFSPTGNEGLTFLNPADRLSELVPMLRPKTDVLILLSHIGHEGELVLAEQFQDLDLIIGGHSHTLVQHPVRVGKTLVAQANHYGSHLGLIKIKVPDTGQAPLVIQGDLIAANELPDGDPATQALVSSYEAKVEDQVDIKIAVIRKNYSKIELQPILEDILAEAIGADLGYYNRTGIRDVLSEGDVTARMIWNLEPFGNTLVKLTLSGADLLILLSQEPTLHHTADTIDPERRYQLATNSFIASHATLAFGDAITAVDTGILVRDILIQQIKAKGLQ